MDTNAQNDPANSGDGLVAGGAWIAAQRDRGREGFSNAFLFSLIAQVEQRTDIRLNEATFNRIMAAKNIVDLAQIAHDAGEGVGGFVWWLMESSEKAKFHEDEPMMTWEEFSEQDQ